tara:strand:- start:132 stop:641 length:510 start_codon:yes stop_codon:yes gene_type:complete
MRVKIHQKNFDNEFKMALYAMVEFTMARLVESKRLRNNLSIDVHFRHHSAEGEAMIDRHANPYRPRHFRVIVDHHRLEKDTYDRVRGTTEWAHEVLKTLAHELVHVKQYVMGELSMRKEGLCYRGVHHNVDTLTEYFELPYEIEAYGREKGLLVSFLAFWKDISEQFEF